MCCCILTLLCTSLPCWLSQFSCFSSLWFRLLNCKIALFQILCLYPHHSILFLWWRRSGFGIHVKNSGQKLCGFNIRLKISSKVGLFFKLKKVLEDCLESIPKRCWALSTNFLYKKLVDNERPEIFSQKIKTKNSNVHDSWKVMGSNQGFLLKYSLLYLLLKCLQDTTIFCIQRKFLLLMKQIRLIYSKKFLTQLGCLLLTLTYPKECPFNTPYYTSWYIQPLNFTNIITVHI